MRFYMPLTIFFITWPKNTQIQVCLALNNSEFHELFKNADGFNHKHIIDNEKHKTNLETFFGDTIKATNRVILHDES